MKKSSLKEKFLGKLALCLILHFSDAECEEILSDYEEWFDNEINAGRKEEEICNFLGSPRKLARKIVVEAGNPPLSNTIFKNSMAKMIVLLVGWAAISLLILRICNKNGVEFFWFAFAGNCLVLGAEIVISKKLKCKGVEIPKCNFPLVFFFFLSLTVALILGQQEFGGTGHIAFMSYYVVFLLFLGVSIYYILRKYMEKQGNVMLTVYHIVGLSNVILFFMNCFRMMDNSFLDYRNKILLGSAILYFQTLVFSYIFYRILSKKV